jgi:hypothetical protein
VRPDDPLFSLEAVEKHCRLADGSGINKLQKTGSLFLSSLGGSTRKQHKISPASNSIVDFDNSLCYYFIMP